VAEVIDLAGIRIQWGLPKNRANRCTHDDMVYDSRERRVWCKSCETTVENFDAFRRLVDEFARMEAAARRKMTAAEEALTATLNRRATKAIDHVWSGNKMAVGCPHCRKGLLPEDFDNGVGLRMSREYELARRLRDGGK
jgi:ribosomal protein S27E